MTVDEMKARLGIESDYALARHEGVSKQCVSKWRKRGWVPRERAGKLQGDHHVANRSDTARTGEA